MAIWGDIKKNKVNSGLNQQSWYESAFYGELFPIWKYTPFVGDGQRDYGELKNMCFYRALTMSLKDNETGETARRKMLYHYLQPYWTGSETSVLDDLFPALSSDNTYLVRAMKNLCVLYDDAPYREIEGKNFDKILELLTESNFNDFMSKLYLLLKFTNNVLYRPVFNLVNGEPVLRHKLYSPDRYRAVYDAYGNILELWLPKLEIVNGNLTDVIYIWTDETIRKIDSNKRQLLIDGQISIENPYKKIPFVELKIDDLEDDTGEILGGSYYELLKAQLDANAIDIDIQNTLIYDSFPIKSMIGYGLEKSTDDIIISPNRIFAKDPDVNQGEIEPYISEVGGSDNYLSLFELKLNRIKQTLKNLGLPASIIEDNPGIPESGVALKEMNKETLQLRKEDINSMKRVEKAMIKMIIHVSNLDEASPLFLSLSDSNDYQIFINFTEPEISREFEAIKTEQDALLNLGYISPLEHYQRLTQDDDTTSEEQLIELITKNIELQNKLKELTNGSEPTSGTDATSAVPATENTGADGIEDISDREETDGDGIEIKPIDGNND